MQRRSKGNGDLMHNGISESQHRRSKMDASRQVGQRALFGSVRLATRNVFPSLVASFLCIGPLILSFRSSVAQAAGAHRSFFDAMRQIREIDELAVSPDGRLAAYSTRTRYDPDTAGPTEVTILDLARKSAKTMTVAGSPHGLQWAPGARHVLGFLMAKGGHERIWQCVPLDSGSIATPVATRDSLGGEILAFAWGPDGASFAYIAAERDSSSPGDVVDPHAPRLVLFNDSPGDYTGPTSSYYARDSAGAYVSVQRVGQSEAQVIARHLVSKKYGPTIAWARNGMLLVNGAPTRVRWGIQISSGVAYTIDPSSGATRQLDPVSRGRRRARWSPSGKYVASIRLDILRGGKLPLATYALQVESAGHARPSISLDSETDGLAVVFPPLWGGNDRILYVARYQRATARLFAIDLLSGEWRAVTPDTLSISRYASSLDGKVLLGVLENANHAQEIFRIDPVSRSLTRLTHLGSGLDHVDLGQVDQVTWKSRDGRFDIDGFLVKPPSYDSTRRYPLILLLHGGPGVSFINSFVGINFAPSNHLPPQLLASAGYMVLLPNPRGDRGYGEEFETALHNDWAPGPFADIDAGVDALIARGLVDSSALGIAGASYGGYLAAYSITQTDRYAAASIDDAPTDLASEYGQNYATRSDWSIAAFDGTPWTRPTIYASQSPITHVSHVRTPVIMRYGGRSSTHDHVRQSYMLAQGFEFYAGLRDSGVPVQFVLHPEEGHGIGDWELYKDWMTRNVAWFDYWILHHGTDPTANHP
jgi:dipeptidyl aminopeptidase/acylaminoacyl peptidase